MQKQHRQVHCLPFPFLLASTVQDVLHLADVRAGEATEKEQLWALPAQLMAALQGPHCGELPGVECPPQCYLISAPNLFLP